MSINLNIYLWRAVKLPFEKMDAELQEVKKENAALYALLDKEELSKSEQYKVDNFEKELNRLETRYNTLVTALATAPLTQGTFNL